jgi:1-acyl-sn-glycerol-3-phosphate acyltransferase
MSESVPLSRFEKWSLALARFTNERPLPKRLSHWFLSGPSTAWVKHAIGPRYYTAGLERVLELRPDRGVIFVSNHRSFFDMYAIMLPLFVRRAAWVQRIFFPVRANFFYESPAGVLVNYAISGGSMYPPIFRDPAKASLNQVAVDKVVALLRSPGVLVGMHPEGTRNKGEDPYELLPAQPGVGQIMLNAKPIVIPIFINGLSNDFVKEIAATRTRSRRERAIVTVFGEPLDYGAMTTSKPRAALYKKTADLVSAKILALAAEERTLRAKIAAGELGDGPAWVMPAVR